MEYEPRLEIVMQEEDTWGRGWVDVFFLLNHWVRTIKDQSLLTNDISIYLTLKDYIAFFPCTLEYYINMWYSQTSEEGIDEVESQSHALYQ